MVVVVVVVVVVAVAGGGGGRRGRGVGVGVVVVVFALVLMYVIEANCSRLGFEMRVNVSLGLLCGTLGWPVSHAFLHHSH